MRKIIINGFPHSGSTILRKIIGDHPDVYDHTRETADWDPPKHIQEDYVVIKFVGLPIKTYPENVIRIMIIKNPWDIFGSLFRRFGNEWLKYHNHQVKDYLHYAERWLYEKEGYRVFCLKYEEMFTDPQVLADMWDHIGLDPYKRELTRRAKVGGHKYTIPDHEPSRGVNIDFRNWQINQPFENKTGDSAPWCPEKARLVLERETIIKQIHYEKDRYSAIESALRKGAG